MFLRVINIIPYLARFNNYKRAVKAHFNKIARLVSARYLEELTALHFGTVNFTCEREADP